MTRLRSLFAAILPFAAVLVKAGGNENEDSLVSSQILTDPYPYHFTPIGSDGAARFPMLKCHGFDLEEASIDDIQTQLASHGFTSVDLLECYYQRIEQTDGYLRSILEFNPDARRIAKALDEERAAGKVRGPLHGIPVIVKDNFATKDRMETTAGSWALFGSVVPRDSHAVHGLRKAGAVLLGKAAMSEWADMRSNNYSEGYSPRGGQARSAYNLTVNPGGSSTGSGVAVGANLVPIALGTETDGSVINPAHRNSVVGIKPTVGLTSRAGVVPECSHQDSVGTFGKTVRDATYALDAIFGIDPRDNYTSAQSGKTPPEGKYADFLTDKSALKGAVFGLPWASFWSLGDPAQVSKLLELVDLIEEAGATIINETEITNYEKLVSPDGFDWDYGTTRGYSNESEYTVVKVDFYNDIKKYLAELKNSDMKSLEDIVQYNIDNYGSEGGLPGIHPAFGSGQDGFLASLESKGKMDETYWQALGFCQSTTRNGINDALRLGSEQPLDGLLVPPELAQTCQVAAQAGYPMITVPAGVNKDSGMPYGLALMNTEFSEASLIKYASAIEDLQIKSEKKYRRTKPKWLGYLQRNIPVPF